MSKRNIIWLVVIVAVAIVLGITVGWLWGVVAAIVVLVGSELFEREMRKRRLAARGITETPSVKDVVSSRRKRR